ncbi:hypothetical protein ACJZ2D_000410 [Fusarium nematophilum]
MKYSAAVLSILTLAATALAAPTEGNGGGKGGDVNVCSNEQSQVCCNGGLLGGCFVQILGSACDGGSYCCESGSATGTLININALNCVNLF